MVRTNAIVLTVTVLFFWHPIDRLSGDDAELIPKTPNQPPKTLISDKAVVKDVVYGLEEQDNHLYLTSRPLDGADRALKREELKFTVPEGARIMELSLARLDGKNLMAAIKVARGNEFDFHCLTFIAPTAGHVRTEFAFYQAKFYTTAAKLGILAVDGKQFHGSVFIVLGEIKQGKGDSLSETEGVFYFAGCPWPPTDGDLSPFHAQSNSFKQ